MINNNSQKKFKNLNVTNHYIFKCHLTWHFYLQQLYLNEKNITNATFLTKYNKCYLLILVITWHPSYNVLLKTYKTSSSNLINEKNNNIKILITIW